MKPEKIPPGTLKHPAKRYLDIDLGEGDDCEYGYHRQELVRIRKPQKCCRGEQEHPIGTLMIKESALVDGDHSTCYLCIPCGDRYIAFDDGEEDDEEELINPHNYLCDGRRRNWLPGHHPRCACCTDGDVARSPV